MKHVSLAALATMALVAVTGCKDAVTSPQFGSELRYASNPPPPPARGIADGAFVATGTTAASIQGTSGLRFSISTTSTCSFGIPVTYFFNPTQNSGWVHFEDDGSTDASSNGSVTQHQLKIDGHGNLVIDCGGGLILTIDLSSISPYPASSINCPIVPDAGPPTGDPLVCFHFQFEDATLSDGETEIEGSVEMVGSPAPPPCGIECECIDCVLLKE